MYPCRIGHHHKQRVDWLCAAVLGVDHDLLSTARLILEVAPAPGKHEKLADISVGRGLDRDLATQVAQQLMARNVLHRHARDELDIMETLSARPVQAALASTASFAVGAAVPLLMVSLSPSRFLVPFVATASLLCLAVLDSWAAKAEDRSVLEGVIHVMFWGS